MLDFTLKQLEIFVCVAEHSSFTAAAGELYLTQSTVSAHVAALETALGAKLFSRDVRRSVSLTPEGRRLYPAAKRVLADCADMRVLLQNEHAEPPLRIGASTAPAQIVLPELLSAFLKKQPDCRYLLRRGDSAQIAAAVRKGEIRIGFIGTKEELAGLSGVPVAEDRLVMVTPDTDRYRELKRRGVYGRELLGEPTVAREEGSGTDRAVVDYMRRVGFPAEKLRIVARIDNPETIRSMVEKGAGVSVLSYLAVRQQAEAGRLLCFEMDADGLRRELYMIWKKDADCTPLERAFLEFAQEASGIG